MLFLLPRCYRSLHCKASYLLRHLKRRGGTAGGAAFPAPPHQSAQEGTQYFHYWGALFLPFLHGYSWAVCDSLPLSIRYISWPQQITAELVALRSTNLLFIYTPVHQTLSAGLSARNTKVLAGRAMFLSCPCSLWLWQDSVCGAVGLRSPVCLMAVSSEGPFSPPATCPLRLRTSLRASVLLMPSDSFLPSFSFKHSWLALAYLDNPKSSSQLKTLPVTLSLKSLLLHKVAYEVSSWRVVAWLTTSCVVHSLKPWGRHPVVVY